MKPVVLILTDDDVTRLSLLLDLAEATTGLSPREQQLRTLLATSRHQQ